MTVDVSLRADRRDLLNDEDWGWWRPGCVGDDAEGQVSIAVRRQGVAVCPLRFSHYLQQLATGKFGERWRVSSRGVVAIAGSGVRMSFTQYPHHVDKSRAGEWQLMACRGVEVDVSLATGSALGSTLLCDEWLKASCQRITDGLEACLVPVTPTGVPCWSLPGASASDAGRAATWEAPPPLPVALVDTVPMLFYHLVVECLTTREAVLLACTCSCLAEALLGESAGEELRLAGTAALAASLAASSSTSNGEDASQAPCTMLHPREDPTFAKLHVHGLLPLRAVATYVTAFAATRPCIVPDSGLVFFDAADAEAAGVAWLDLLARERREDPTGGCAPLQVGGELNHSGAGAGVNADGAANAGLASSSPHHFVVDFTWRPHILEHFFSACGQSTYSALARVEIPAGAEFFSDSVSTNGRRPPLPPALCLPPSASARYSSHSLCLPEGPARPP